MKYNFCEICGNLEVSILIKCPVCETKYTDISEEQYLEFIDRELPEDLKEEEHETVTA